MGNKREDGKCLPRFRSETKLLALLNAIGSDGFDVLESPGFDLNSDTEEHLKSYHNKVENIHVE